MCNFHDIISIAHEGTINSLLQSIPSHFCGAVLRQHLPGFHTNPTGLPQQPASDHFTANKHLDFTTRVCSHAFGLPLPRAGTQRGVKPSKETIHIKHLALGGSPADHSRCWQTHTQGVCVSLNMNTKPLCINDCHPIALTSVIVKCFE